MARMSTGFDCSLVSELPQRPLPIAPSATSSLSSVPP